MDSISLYILVGCGLPWIIWGVAVGISWLWNLGGNKNSDINWD